MKSKNLIDQEYYLKNKEIILQKRREYRKKNKEKLQDYWATYRSKNKDKIAIRNAETYKKLKQR